MKRFEFYSVAEEGQEPKDEFQLKHMGERRSWLSFGKNKSRNNYGDIESNWHTLPDDAKRIYKSIDQGSYDLQFIEKMLKIRPVYNIVKLVEYHLSYHTSIGGDRRTFYFHVKYEILGHIQKWGVLSLQAEVLKDWLQHTFANSNFPNAPIMHSININNNQGPVQLQIDSDNSTQNINSGASLEELKMFLLQLKNITESLTKEQSQALVPEINSALMDINSNKQVEPSTLSKIGGLLKDIGVNVVANLIATPIPDAISSLFGFIK